MAPLHTPTRKHDRRDEGFALIGLVVAIFLILLALSVAAPPVVKELRREREVEAVHRAGQYTRAIQLYSKKAGGYPGSIEQLEKTNNVRYLRQKYNDPMTGKPDWRLIKVGTNKTTVKGFFGQPLTGLNGGSLGSASSMASAGGIGTPVGAGVSGSGAGASPFGSPSASSPMNPQTGTATDGSTPANSAGTGTSAATGLGGSGIGSSVGGQFMGVGLPVAGSAMIVVNEQTNYPDWEFLYDPRIEQLKAKVNIFGGGMSSSSSSSLGSANSMASGMPSQTTTTPQTSTTPGSTPPSP